MGMMSGWIGHKKAALQFVLQNENGCLNEVCMEFSILRVKLKGNHAMTTDKMNLFIINRNNIQQS